LVWDHSLDNFRLGSFAWELSLGIFRLEASAWELLLDSFRLGSFAWELSLGIIFIPLLLLRKEEKLLSLSSPASFPSS
jgi:hypothetical protein